MYADMYVYMCVCVWQRWTAGDIVDEYRV